MKKRTALVTGASRGIGKAIAKVFAAQGYDLILACRHSETELTILAEELKKDCRISCQTFIGDLSDYEAVILLFKEITELDVLVNNAGISYVGLLSEMPSESWDSVIGTNLNAAFYCSKLAIPLMLQKKSGKIINISSVWGSCGASMEVAYSASKGGLNAFTRALAKELAPSGIQVNAIACGMMDTDMNRNFSEEDLSQIVSEIPADRMGRPEEAAALVLQLCTGNTYLTGQIIQLDGGWI
ncbi:MAG: SDR family NAD(P)-dependent oxidoreductase [Lachnospiraceae bacterium]